MRSAQPHFIVLGAALAAALAITNVPTMGQSGAAVASNDFPNPYKIENFGQLPAGRKMGQTYGIAVIPKGPYVPKFEDRNNGAPVASLELSAPVTPRSTFPWLKDYSLSGVWRLLRRHDLRWVERRAVAEVRFLGAARGELRRRDVHLPAWPLHRRG